MKKAVYPGSFDPFTNGHLDIVERSLLFVDHLTIAILNNTSKKGIFSAEERVEMIQEVVKDYKNVKVESFTGLLVDYCTNNDIHINIRGLRAVTDFDYEHAIYLMNDSLKKDLETIFLMSGIEHSFISSTIVKEVASLKGDISKQVPSEILKHLNRYFA